MTGFKKKDVYVDTDATVKWRRLPTVIGSSLWGAGLLAPKLFKVELGLKLELALDSLKL